MKVLLIMAIAILLCAGKPTTNGYEVGDFVSDFKLKNVDGKMISMADFTDAKGFIIVFDCNTCPVSRIYNTRIIDLNKKYASKGFQLIAINPNSAQASPGDSYEKMVEYAKEKKYEFPYLYDATQGIVTQFGATNTPHTFIVNKVNSDFKIVYIGAIDNNPYDGSKATNKFVEEAIDALLEGKPVPNPKTKAIGCMVKWPTD
ncbi:MAG TPA: thioredoxin family protein [Cyclobacteriaceae bacterium]